MKTNELFDRMEYDTEQLDESTIVDPETVDPNAVMCLVKQRMAQEPKKSAHKKSKRKRVVSLAAAALVSAAICTTAIATGAFQTVFVGKIIEENPNASVLNVPIDYESDEVNLVCNGVSGDAHNMFASFTITKKDGSAFVENTDGLIIPHDPMTEDPSQVIQMVECPTAVVNDAEHSYSGYIDYQFKDEKTLQAFLSYNSYGYDISGKPITMKQGKIFAYRLKDIIYQAEREPTPDGELSYNYKKNKQMLEQIAAEYQPKLKEGEAIRFDYDQLALRVVDRVEIPVNFAGSFTVDPGTVSRKLIEPPTEVDINGSFCTLTEITATPFSLHIKADCFQEEEAAGYFIENLTVELKNGKIITAEMESFRQVAESGPDEGKVTANYIFARREDDFQFIYIDPDDIVSIHTNNEYIPEHADFPPVRIF